MFWSMLTPIVSVGDYLSGITIGSELNSSAGRPNANF
jgi:hypothetical protein